MAWLGFRGYDKVTKEYTPTGQLTKTTHEYQPGKTLWDLLQLLIIPLVLAVGGYLFSWQLNQTNLQLSQRQHDNDQAIALSQQRETTLKTCMDDIRDLLLNRGLAVSEAGSEVRVIAKTEVLAALRQLDGERKGTLMQFLSEAKLITTSGNGTIIDLRGADLSGADLSGIELSGLDLRGANLRGAHLNDAGLNGADLSGVDLTGVDLSGADLSGADLSGAKVRNKQLAQAKSLHGAIMPDGSIHP